MRQPTVFVASLVAIIVLLALACINGPGMGEWFAEIQSGISEYAGWFYLLSTSGFVVFAITIACSRYGSIRLGADDERPAFPMLTWFAMLFSAGMGIGLLFYGIAEPILHYQNPPYGEGQTFEAARTAMHATFFHWGLHPWGVYAIVGLIFAYFSFRKGLPLSVRSALHPFLGERIYGPIGHAVDTVAIVATLFGVATSLGLGAAQINSGLAAVFSTPESITVQIIIIAVITAMATISVVTGLKAGIRRLSELNMGLASLLLLFVTIVGPTALIVSAFVDNLGGYLGYLLHNSLRTGAFAPQPQKEWLSAWTLFYWGWWIAWAPFVGMFIAKISRGRTVREFLIGTLVVPSILAFIWLTVFGNAALYLEINDIGQIAEAVAANKASALFVFLEQFPLYSVTSIAAIICVVLFFVTSSDSASLVVDTIASGGAENPPVWQRVFWACFEGVVAIVLLFAGGLEALQTAAITVALPFCALLIVMCLALLKSLQQEQFKCPPE